MKSQIAELRHREGGKEEVPFVLGLEEQGGVFQERKTFRQRTLEWDGNRAGSLLKLKEDEFWECSF